ncbi:MAG: diadenylate cyclase [Desulfobacteraceae bacterium]|nr:diadenylate cyclase [Desulfobacteraceae bacterium]
MFRYNASEGTRQEGRNTCMVRVLHACWQYLHEAQLIVAHCPAICGCKKDHHGWPMQKPPLTPDLITSEYLFFQKLSEHFEELDEHLERNYTFNDTCCKRGPKIGHSWEDHEIKCYKPLCEVDNGVEWLQRFCGQNYCTFYPGYLEAILRVVGGSRFNICKELLDCLNFYSDICVLSSINDKKKHSYKRTLSTAAFASNAAKAAAFVPFFGSFELAHELLLVCDDLHIDEGAFLKIMRSLERVAAFRHENKEISAGVILCPRQENWDKIKKSLFATNWLIEDELSKKRLSLVLQKTKDGKREDAIETLSLSDGSKTFFRVNRKGLIRGMVFFSHPRIIECIDKEIDISSPIVEEILIVPEKLYTGRDISVLCAEGALVARVENSAVDLYYRGRLIASYVYGAWKGRDYCRLWSKLLLAGNMINADMGVLQKINELALTMSDQHTGGTLVLLDKNSYEKNKNKFSKMGLRQTYSSDFSRPIEKWKLSSLIKLTGQDGATIISKNGKLLDFAINLSPSTQAKQTAQQMKIGGTRKTNALAITYNLPDCLVIVISDDGPVWICCKGEIIAKV